MMGKWTYLKVIKIKGEIENEQREEKRITKS